MKKADFYIHQNEIIDLVYIRPQSIPFSEQLFLFDTGDILDKIITLGYPRIPGFDNHLTVEQAQISSRYSPSIGTVASKGFNIWVKDELLLITAKIRGGNSGGPVIKMDGSVIGIAVNVPVSKGDYDDLEYGTVLPIKYILEICKNQNKEFILDVKSIEFKDFN